jgi:hypothetical protein
MANQFDRLYWARKMGLSPVVCHTIFKGEPIHIGYRRFSRLESCHQS